MILLFRRIGKTDGTICLRDFSKGIVYLKKDSKKAQKITSCAIL